MSLFADYNLPFVIALGVMGLLALLQFVGIADLDFDADVDLDADLGADVDAGTAGVAGAITTLLGLGKVPFLVWLMVFLLLFALIGLSLQAFAADLTGAPLYSWLAAVFSLGATLPATAVLVRPLGGIMPKDETSAVRLDSLIGRRGTVTTGRAARGSPARTRIRDRFGHPHYVMLEPHEDTSEIHEGDEVLIVRREGQIFYGTPLTERKLAPLA